MLYITGGEDWIKGFAVYQLGDQGYGFAENQDRQTHFFLTDGFHTKAVDGKIEFGRDRIAIDVLKEGDIIFARVVNNGRGWHAEVWGLASELDIAYQAVRVVREMEDFRRHQAKEAVAARNGGGKPAPAVPPVSKVVSAPSATSAKPRVPWTANLRARRTPRIGGHDLGEAMDESLLELANSASRVA